MVARKDIQRKGAAPLTKKGHVFRCDGFIYCTALRDLYLGDLWGVQDFQFMFWPAPRNGDRILCKELYEVATGMAYPYEYEWKPGMGLSAHKMMGF